MLLIDVHCVLGPAVDVEGTCGGELAICDSVGRFVTRHATTTTDLWETRH